MTHEATLKQVLITGSNRGIGLALTRLYCKQNWQVIACCRDPESATELKALSDEYQNLDVFALDVTDYDAVKILAADLKNVHLNLLINNAGYYGPKGYAFGETDVAEWRKVFEINTIAPMKMIEAFNQQLKNGNGLIANMSSAMGSMGENASGGSYIYRSSKAALNAITKSMSIDGEADGIRAIALHPGWVKTDMGGTNALLTTEQSVTGLKSVLDNFNDSQNGAFYDSKGRNLAW
ncbi:SDR family oxidoreductase [Parashewanella spongiae]|uniref:SDR family oxidoreductase n=1 Tax=Parashewanella spongiae TaxID=342950 RepID=A0A3A6TEW9_9GAMM|nr:SDR family oxidoreductase [Parashewanella spongiae]MCL1079704.1 SDR family oxidoreductase [Parashewanella spongiae]RJY07172.1 SDR family oxidoreductase [Parashewanella spongiae]